MSIEHFDNECPGCRPAILDATTLQKLPDDHPIMVAALKAWADTPLMERYGFHRFTCLNSRDALDVMAMQAVTKRIEKYLEGLKSV